MTDDYRWREPGSLPFELPSTPLTKTILSVLLTGAWGFALYRDRRWSNILATTISLSHVFHFIDSELSVRRIPPDERFAPYTLANTYETFFLPYDYAVMLTLFVLKQTPWSVRDRAIATTMMLKNLPFYLKLVEADVNNPPLRLGLLDTPTKRSVFELLHAAFSVYGCLYFR